VVLDEADQMLDMGFEEDMEVILQQVRRQLTVMFYVTTVCHNSKGSW
jgi:superfamily II DNA/RNA helicase